jgi:hypothetical protein
MTFMSVTGVESESARRTWTVSTKPEKVALQNLPKSRVLMVHAAAAMHHVTIITDKPASIRTAALYGIEKILNDDRLMLDMLVRQFDRFDWRAPQYVHVGLKSEDLLSVKECQRYLGVVRNSPLRKGQVLILGLLRMARPEFGWHANMTCLDI